MAVEFSPNFQIDRIIGFISDDGTGATFQCYHFETALLAFNASIDGFDTNWTTGVDLGTGGALTSADIAFIDTYDSTDSGERITLSAWDRQEQSEQTPAVAGA